MLSNKDQESLVWGVECTQCKTPILPITSWDQPFTCQWCNAKLADPGSFEYVLVQCSLCRQWSIIKQDIVADYVCPCRIREIVHDPDTSLLLLQRYALLGILGKGSAGEVWLADDIKVSPFQRVAIKFIKENSEDLAVRGKREAVFLSHIHHHGVIPIYGYFHGIGFPVVENRKIARFDFIQGSACIVMKYIAGGNLQEWISNKNVTPQLAAEILIKVCEALDAIHKMGIVHRDLKPTNILMDGDNPIIVDFGLSRPVDATSITSMGTIMGSIDFMSPEQAQGMKADSRSDLYSVGAIIWKMLMKQSLFHSESPLAQLRKIVRDPIPQEIERFPLELQSILKKLLDKNPQMRFQTADEVKQALLHFSKESPDKDVPLYPRTSDKIRKTQPKIPVIRRPCTARLSVTNPRLPKFSEKHTKRIRARANRRRRLIIVLTAVIILTLLLLVFWKFQR